MTLSQINIPNLQMLKLDRIDPPKKHSILIDTLIQTILSCEATKELYEKAKTVSSDLGYKKLSIKIYESLESRAEFNPLNQEIRLSNELTEDELLSHCLFELTNVIHQPLFRELNIRAINRTITCEDYTKEVEKIEFKGSLMHASVVSTAIKERGWSSSLNIFKNLEDSNFEYEWHSRIRFSAHAEYGRKVYQMLSGIKSHPPGFCAKLSSARYLISHISLKDIKTTLTIVMTSLIMGFAIGSIAEGFNRGSS